MKKEHIIQRITDVGLVAVIRAESADQARRMTDACIEGGVAAVEITFTVPGAHRVIETLADTYTDGSILLGAGTVLDPETARIAMLSGAQYVVCPHFNEDTVRMCNRYRVPCMPGCASIREVVSALESGADIIKLFPGELFGPKAVKAIRGPLPQAQIMPTGGVDINNVGDWFKAGVVAVGVGGGLTSGAKDGNYASITERAKEFLARIKDVRG
nr:bifunctional 2-keto-4-hydroxyglutarate aldolase/2-keto-3-deoxy-6-phosphogluconate aldolase [bacterium]